MIRALLFTVVAVGSTFASAQEASKSENTPTRVDPTSRPLRWGPDTPSEVTGELRGDGYFGVASKEDESVSSVPPPPRAGLVDEQVFPPNADAAPSGGAATTQVAIHNSRVPKNGINMRPEVPSIRPVVMSPASQSGGDELELLISPIYDVLIYMPEPISHYTTSNTSLNVSIVASMPRVAVLKMAPVQAPVPISLHIIDVLGDIWTFTLTANAQVDLATEYPRTIMVKRRASKKRNVGFKNPASILNALDVGDAVKIVTNGLPSTGEYEISLASARAMNHDGYALLSFRVSRRDLGELPRRADGSGKFTLTLWANDRKLDGGSFYESQRAIEWRIDPLMSKVETRQRGIDTMAIHCVVRLSVLEIEEWQSAFVTLQDDVGYTKFSFQPIRRDFRAPLDMNQ